MVEAEIVEFLVKYGEGDLLKRLVKAELDRKCQAIDDIVVQGYGEYIGKHGESNQEAVKVAVLELGRSPLADLERKLEASGPGRSGAGSR